MTQRKIRKLLAGADEDAEGLDEAPRTRSAGRANLWICGEHRVRCGDATVLADIDARSTASSPTSDFRAGCYDLAADSFTDLSRTP